VVTAGGTKQNYKGRQTNELLFVDQVQTWNFRDRKWKFPVFYLRFGTKCADVVVDGCANETGV
jgi:hypothetical protein